MPLWMKILFWIILLLLLIIIIYLILHIKVLPKKYHLDKNACTLIVNGTPQPKSAVSYEGSISGGQMTVLCKFQGTKVGVVMDVKPGKESYLYKSHKRRYVEVKSSSVRKRGDVTEASINNAKFALDTVTGKFERTPKNTKPFELKHNQTVRFSGATGIGRSQQVFTVTAKLNFDKKK